MDNVRIQEALNEKSKYTYENGVLVNKLEIKNQEELDNMEAALTYLRLNNLHMQENKFSFNYMYYLNLHKYIFQDLYSFAGEVRSENITKGNTPFCRPEFVVKYLKSTLEDMQKKVHTIKSKEDYIKYLAYFYSEINIIHPFREGNGRTLREYLRQTVEYLNNFLPLPALELDYSDISDETRINLINGSIISAATGDIALLEKFFENVLKEKTIEKKQENHL